MKIGFFDSGIGGVTVLHEALKVIPEADYIYYADTENVPYGQKKKEAVKQYVMAAAGFIASKGIDALVIACNTATSIAVEDLRAIYGFPVIGMEPAVKPAIENCIDKRVLVLATHLTLSEEKFKALLFRVDKNHIVDFFPAPELVTFAEKLEFESPEVLTYLKDKLLPMDMDKYATIVLGCTHFSFFRNAIRKIVPGDISIIDGTTGTVNNLKRILKQKGSEFSGSGRVEYYDSGRIVSTERELEKYRILMDFLDRSSGS